MNYRKEYLICKDMYLKERKQRGGDGGYPEGVEGTVPVETIGSISLLYLYKVGGSGA